MLLNTNTKLHAAMEAQGYYCPSAVSFDVLSGYTVVRVDGPGDMRVAVVLNSNEVFQVLSHELGHERHRVQWNNARDLEINEVIAKEHPEILVPKDMGGIPIPTDQATQLREQMQERARDEAEAAPVPNPATSVYDVSRLAAHIELEPDKAEVPTDPGRLYDVIFVLIGRCHHRPHSRVATLKYLLRLPDQFAVLAMRELHRLDPTIAQAPEFLDFCKRFRDVLINKPESK